jgi:hypothetical protein
LHLLHKLSLPCRLTGIAASVLISAACLSGCGSGSNKCITDCTIPPPATTTVTFTAPQSPLVKGQDATFSVLVTPSTATGAISIFDNTDIGVSNPTPIATGTLSNGAASITLKPPYAGTRLFVVTYAGDSADNSSGSRAEIPVIVPASATSCGLGTATYIAGQPAPPNAPNYVSTVGDDSAICASGTDSSLTLNGITVTKSGVQLDQYGYVADGVDPSGIDAAVLAYGSSATSSSGATIDLTSPTITTNGATYAAFASGLGSTINIAQATINATSTQAVLGAGNNGQLTITDSQITTDSSPLAIFNGGSLQLTDTDITETDSASPTFVDNNTSAASQISFSMTGGSISRTIAAGVSPGALFSISGNQNLTISLSHVDLSNFFPPSSNSLSSIEPQTASSRLPLLIRNPRKSAGSIATADDANPTENQTLTLNLDNQKLVGTVSGTDYSSVITLKHNSAFDGDAYSQDSISLDASSTWTIHSSFQIKTFNDPGGISGNQILNVTGNGQTIGYSNAANPQLGGKTYSLQGSGTLVPY